VKKFLLVYEPKTSSYHTVKPICDLFDEIDICDINDFHQINHNQYYRIIFRHRKALQSWRKANSPMNDDKYIFFSNGGVYPFKTASNGFSEYIRGKQDYFLPICSILNTIKRKDTQKVIGYYIDKQIYDDEEKHTLKQIKNNDTNEVCELGLDYIDKYEFFSNITDYYYYQPKKVDSMPNIVLEAVSADIPIIHGGEKMKDGFKDIMDAKQYMNFDVFKRIWEFLIERNFEYGFEKEKYKTFDEWIEKEII